MPYVLENIACHLATMKNELSRLWIHPVGHIAIHQCIEKPFQDWGFDLLVPGKVCENITFKYICINVMWTIGHSV